MSIILEGKNLTRDYISKGSLFSPRKTVRALKGVSFQLERGKTLAIVGESGCGKSTLARILTMIDAPTSGELTIDEQSININQAPITPEQRRSVQIVFQNPYGSLNPRQKIGDVLTEPLLLNTDKTAEDRKTLALGMLKKVGMQESHYDRLPPHVFWWAKATYRHSACFDAQSLASYP